MSENKVLLVLVDGMRPDSIAVCGNPAFQKYFEEGSYSYTAQTIFPPKTLSAHLSMFQSVGPERHGVLSNTFVQSEHPVTGLFEKIYAAKKRSSVFYTWQQMRDCWAPRKAMTFAWMMNQGTYYGKIDVDRYETKVCKEHIAELAPDFVWLYLQMADKHGHDFGWMSPEYIDAVRIDTECIMDMVSCLPPEYSVLITADHGGHELDHGDNIPEDMTIPITCHGPMFEKGKKLTDVSIIDIAPTIAEILGIDPDPEWEGRSLIGR